MCCDMYACCYIYIYIYIYIYMFIALYICDLSVKLTLSACVWRWLCTRYTGADVCDAGGSSAA